MTCSKWENQTAVTEFLLLGVAEYQDTRHVFIMLFLILYLLSLVGNSFIIAAVNLDPLLHTPMYFFISNLSFVDLCMTSVTVPKYLGNLLTRSLSISFLGCITQMYLFIWLATTESFLLAVMAYDRYIAICQPLRYTQAMTEKFCVLLVVASWVLTSLHALLHVSMTLHLCFCGPNAINSFFCDHPPVLSLSCSDTAINHLVLQAEGLFLAAIIVFFTLATYGWIITSILRLHSALSRKKAFLTCSSHLTVITLFYGTGGSAYLLPSSVTSKGNNTLVGMMYALVTPMINPFIYSLRNKEMKTTLKNALWRKY